jgi:hypothetical protein
LKFALPFHPKTIEMQHANCSFSFDSEAFPDPASYIRTVKEKYNVKVCVWINSYISQRASIFQEGVDNDYFIKRTNGDVWQWDLWQDTLPKVRFESIDADIHQTLKQFRVPLASRGIGEIDNSHSKRTLGSVSRILA